MNWFVFGTVLMYWSAASFEGYQGNYPKMCAWFGWGLGNLGAAFIP